MTDYVTGILCMYIFIFVKYLCSTSIYLFNVQLILATSLVLSVFLFGTNDDINNGNPNGNSNGNTNNTNTSSLGNFYSHIFFISTCLTLISDIVSTIFYFGFVNTIGIINLLIVIYTSGIADNIVVKLYKSNMNTYTNTYTNQFINTYTNQYYPTVSTYTDIVSTYLWDSFKNILSTAKSINTTLSNNNQSNNIKTKLKNYVVEKYIIGGSLDLVPNYQSSLLFEQDFQLTPKLSPKLIPNLSPKLIPKLSVGNIPLAPSLVSPFNNSQHIFADQKQYKNILTNKNINMSFLQNTNLEHEDSLDDLDEALDLSNVPIVPEKQILEAENFEKEITDLKAVPTKTPRLETAAERKAAIRKKLAEKKSARAAGRAGGNVSQKDLKKILNNPAMTNMMEKMMAQNGDSAEVPDMAQVKQMIQGLGKMRK